METLSRAGLLSSPNFAELTCPAPLPIRTSPFHRGCALSRKNPRFSVFRNALPGNELATEDALQMFLRERQLNGDFISKATDILWIRGNLESFDSEISIYGEIPQQLEEVIEKENDGGFLKLKKTQEWVLGDNIAPINKKANTKELQNNSERRKRLNFLKYEAQWRPVGTVDTFLLDHGFFMFRFFEEQDKRGSLACWTVANLPKTLALPNAAQLGRLFHHTYLGLSSWASSALLVL